MFFLLLFVFSPVSSAGCGSPEVCMPFGDCTHQFSSFKEVADKSCGPSKVCCDPTENPCDLLPIKGLMPFVDDNKCYEPLSQGPCPTDKWLAVDPKTTKKNVLTCVKKPCKGENQILYGGACMDGTDGGTVCKGNGQEWALNPDGSAYCFCDPQHYLTSADGKCVPLFQRGSCPLKQIVAERNGLAVCISNPCGMVSNSVPHPKTFNKVFKPDNKLPINLKDIEQWCHGYICQANDCIMDFIYGYTDDDEPNPLQCQTYAYKEEKKYYADVSLDGSPICPLKHMKRVLKPDFSYSCVCKDGFLFNADKSACLPPYNRGNCKEKEMIVDVKGVATCAPNPCGSSSSSLPHPFTMERYKPMPCHDLMVVTPDCKLELYTAYTDPEESPLQCRQGWEEEPDFIGKPDCGASHEFCPIRKRCVIKPQLGK